MNMKRILLLFVTLIFTVSMVSEANAVGARSMKLGVNDRLTDIIAISQEGTFYVPVRDLSKELDFTLVNQLHGIELMGPAGTLWLSLGEDASITPDGSEITLHTFKENGKLMVPLKVASYLGYIISYKPEQYLLRVHNLSAQLEDEAFINQYQKELIPMEEPVITPEPEVSQDGKVVYLSFDDGPSVNTSQLLDILAKYDVKATFFMIGPHMNQYPAQVKRIAKEEQGMGLHGMTHRKEKFYASPSAALTEMKADQVILKKITGVVSNLIRVPYGSKPYFTKPFRDKMLHEDFKLWDWNVDSEDWRYKENSGKTYDSVMTQVHRLQKLKVNPVILMHDQKDTLKVLPRILESLQKEGYQFEIITKDIEPVNFWKDTR